MKLPDKPGLHVKIASPTQIFYDGQAVSVSAVNEVGNFDILEGHANFFTLLTEGEAIVFDGYQYFNFPITKGVMKVTNNDVSLFVDIEPVYSASR
jgi:F0F1-type ATP synthase epsilon subunit